MNQRAPESWFKVVAVQQVIRNGLDLPGVARELGVGDELLKSWLRRYATTNGGMLPEKWQLKTQATEILALSQELREIHQEKGRRTCISPALQAMRDKRCRVENPDHDELCCVVRGDESP